MFIYLFIENKKSKYCNIAIYLNNLFVSCAELQSEVWCQLFFSIFVFLLKAKQKETNMPEEHFSCSPKIKMLATGSMGTKLLKHNKQGAP